MEHRFVDNLSRPGAQRNRDWLLQQCDLCVIEYQDAEHLNRIFKEHSDTDVILHLAGQVAVTTSVTDSHSAFDANALGNFNVLEATHLPESPFMYSSTNKVYGGIEDLNIVERETRCHPKHSIERQIGWNVLLVQGKTIKGSSIAREYTAQGLQ